MVHELPYMAYAKAGIFLPPFGTYLDDHTSFIRQDFELSLSTSDSTVVAAEIGPAPNYPYANLAVFKNSAQSTAPDPTSDPGYGTAVSFGWRDLGWSLGAHGMVKRRSLEAGGNLDAAGVSWGLAWIGDLPLTFAGELSVGRRSVGLTAGTVTHVAVYQEAVWQLFNGLALHGNYDLADEDISIAEQVQQRFSLALDIAFFPGLTLFAQGRVLFPGAGQGAQPDFLAQTHIWF